MITTTTEIDRAQTESTTEATIAAVASDALDNVSGGWCGPYAAARGPYAVAPGPYAVARYAAHLERRAEWIEHRAERIAYRWGY